MNDDLHSLMNVIDENKNLYGDVISGNKISRDQSRALMINNEKIRDIIVEYRHLAVALKERKESFDFNNSSLNAYKLSRVYYEWNAEGADQSLGMQKQNQVEISDELNSSWSAIADEFISIDFELGRNDWLNFIEALESQTIRFMEKNKIDSIEEMWS
ncbi:hypothetical protein [Paenibacillus sp. B01]|uniref:hypothetical protein n=1 Tax=Paenibacillus sp. B01 TaxID=2660554 RepID=UPI00129A4209|nr:hypothetical protein [Paenibacillus sp. B01]QGG57704.1 hypothetical protein GE073_20305 [Paenibacillus sp. B01]